jgi:ATP-dependent Zn protease
MEKLAWSDASGWDIDEAMKHILNHPRKYDRVISETGHEELLCHILLWEIAKDIHMPQHKITHFEELVKANFGELKLIEDEDGSWNFYPKNSPNRNQNRFPL